MYISVYIYPLHNPETVHRNTLVLEYSVPIINSERNSKPYMESQSSVPLLRNFIILFDHTNLRALFSFYFHFTFSSYSPTSSSHNTKNLKCSPFSQQTPSARESFPFVVGVRVLTLFYHLSSINIR